MRLYPPLLIAALLSGCATQPAYVPSGAPASVSATPVKAGDFWQTPNDPTVTQKVAWVPRSTIWPAAMTKIS